MGSQDDVGPVVKLPRAFCWTKYGTEAGESAAAILRRKEIERQRNCGVFLWGIGSSLRPSLLDLVKLDGRPAVVFSPMRSRPTFRDTSPESVVMWCGGIGLDGLTYRLPRYSLVTSRVAGGIRPKSHYALVCQRDGALGEDAGIWTKVSRACLRNLRTGAAIGDSQVTAIVERTGEDGGGGEYPVTTVARLVPPYMVKLTMAVTLARPLHLNCASDESLRRSVDLLLQQKGDAVWMFEAALL
jgi:hypothetical protein